MAVTAWEGVVRDGKIRLIDDVPLPENARVYVIVGEISEQPPTRVRTPRLARPEQAVDFRKQIAEVDTDAGL